MNHPQSIPLFSTCRPMLLAALMALGSFGALACKNTSSSSQSVSSNSNFVDLSNDATAKATVVALDKAERLVTLRREDGNMLTVEAGPEVRNFDRIDVGDALNVRYHESLSAMKLPAGSSTTPAEGAFVAGRAKKGADPAGGVARAARVRVRITSVDRTNHVVMFALDSGEQRSVRAVRPEGREFVESLKVGDIVQLDYKESLALSIDKL